MKILMLGNGFDLQHKLPTTYISFIKVISKLVELRVEIMMVDEKTNICRIISQLQNECKEIKDFYSVYKSILKDYDILNSDLAELSNLCASNCWYNYFSNHCLKERNWIDFEKEIDFVINEFELLFENQCKKKRSFKSYEIDNANNKILLKCFDFFFDIINDNGYEHILVKKDYINKVAFETDMYEIDKESIIAKLYDELVCFSKIFKMYLSIFVYEPLKRSDKKTIEKVFKKEFKNFEHVITFNYTNTYEMLYGKTSMHYIHGKLDSDIIFGIDSDESDELNELDNPFMFFKKYYQRVVNRTDNSFINMINAVKKDREEPIQQKYYNLVVCGHSLDITDQDIIKDVFAISDTIYVICHKLEEIGKYVSNLVRIYRKPEFDRIRSEKNLQFITYEEWEFVEYEEDFAL